MTNYEEKIKELESRIEVLEKAEQKRKRQKMVRIVFKIIAVLLVIGFSIFLYYSVKPYLEQIKDLGGFSDKSKEGKDYLKDTWESLYN